MRVLLRHWDRVSGTHVDAGTARAPRMVARTRRRVAALVVPVLGGCALLAVAGDGPAAALAGGVPVTAQAYPFAVRLVTGDFRSCSGVLVASRWVLTTRSCFFGEGAQVAAGAPAQATTAIVGRADLTTTDGVEVTVTQVVPRTDRDVAMARLAKPVQGVEPVAVSGSAPQVGQLYRVLGYGRTATAWVSDRLRAAMFEVTAVGTTTVDVLASSSAPASICIGDAGGPALVESGRLIEVAAVSSASWQGGCLEVTDPRRGAVQTRVDDLADWVRTTSGSSGSRGSVSGSGGPASGVRLVNLNSRMCLVARDGSGERPVLQVPCADSTDQLWSLGSATDDGRYEIRNDRLGTCVITRWQGRESSATVGECDAQYPDQLWSLEKDEDAGGWRFRNSNSRMCLAVRGQSAGTQARQVECGDWPDQLWRWEAN